MTIDEMAGPDVDEDLGDPADLGERTREGSLLLAGVGAPVGWIGDEGLRSLLAVTDDAVAPGGRDGRSWGRTTVTLGWDCRSLDGGGIDSAMGHGAGSFPIR
jgi:hypothetical protein